MYFREKRSLKNKLISGILKWLFKIFIQSQKFNGHKYEQNGNSLIITDQNVDIRQTRIQHKGRTAARPVSYTHLDVYKRQTLQYIIARDQILLY